MALASLVALAATADVLSSALAERWIKRQPTLALQVRPDQRAASIRLAEYYLDEGEATRALAQARRTLAIRPMDAEALRVVALARELEGHPEETRRLLGVVSSWTKRDTPTQLWLFNQGLARGNYGLSFQQADLLLRRRPEYGTMLFPAMVAGLGNSGALSQMTAMLAKKPAWRPNFLGAVVSQTPDPIRAFEIFRQLARTSAPPTPDELTPHFMTLARAGSYDLAARQWASITPDRGAAPQGVFDGDFNEAQAAPPFNWLIGKSPRAVVEMAPAPDREGEQALHVMYDGYSSPELLGQAWTLKPGQYILVGEQRLSSPQHAKYLTWKIYCAGSAEVLGQQSRTLPRDGPQVWAPFQVEFEVPAQRCDAQWLRLEPRPGDRTTDVDVWYDKLNVRVASR